MILTDSQIKMMQEDLYADLAQLLMERWNYTSEQALDALYNSETFARLQDKRTGLYYQSPGHVYAYLEDELRQGVFGR